MLTQRSLAKVGRKKEQGWIDIVVFEVVDEDV
jgi:hypothetical protein